MEERNNQVKPWYSGSILDWIFTTNHKKIGAMYFGTSLVFFIVAVIFAFFMKSELQEPGLQVVDSQTYNYMVTAHGIIMLLWWAISAWTGGFANFFVPVMIGAKDVAFPRLNAFSYWAFLGASIFVLLTMLPENRIKMMWTGYAPYSLVQDAGPVLFYAFAIHLLGVSSISTAINFIVTIIRMRAPGVGFLKMNLFVHSILATNIIQLVGVPSFAGAVTMLLLDKYFGTNFFNPELGGNPLVYQNIFWFYSHPAVYVMILPVFGMFSEIISVFARKKIFGYNAMVISIWLITFIGFLVWVHHMFTSGIPNWVRVLMSYTTLLVGVPTGVKVFNWIITLYKGSIRIKTPFLFVIAALFTFVVGGLTGIALGVVSIDLALHDSYFVVAHFHYVLGMTATMTIFAALFYWLPKISGKIYNEILGLTSFGLIFIGANVTYFPMFILGFLGMPRRYVDYPPIPEYVFWHNVSSFGAYILVAGILLAIFTLIYSIIRGQEATENPWESNSLEWKLPSPFGLHNFPDNFKVDNDWEPYKYNTR